jgi:hypothetical protein
VNGTGKVNIPSTPSNNGGYNITVTWYVSAMPFETAFGLQITLSPEQKQLAKLNKIEFCKRIRGYEVCV